MAETTLIYEAAASGDSLSSIVCALGSRNCWQRGPANNWPVLTSRVICRVGNSMFFPDIERVHVCVWRERERLLLPSSLCSHFTRAKFHIY